MLRITEKGEGGRKLRYQADFFLHAARTLNTFVLIALSIRILPSEQRKHAPLDLL